MTNAECTMHLLAALDAASIPYMVVGSLSSNAHGLARSTRDADIVVQAPPQSIAELVRGLGPPYRLDPQLSFETVTGTRRFVVTLLGSEFKIETFFLTEDPHDQSRFSRRMRTAVNGTVVWVAAPEAQTPLVPAGATSERHARRRECDGCSGVEARHGLHQAMVLRTWNPRPARTAPEET